MTLLPGMRCVYLVSLLAATVCALQQHHRPTGIVARHAHLTKCTADFEMQRRSFFGIAFASAATAVPRSAAAADQSTKEVTEYMLSVKEALEPLPGLLQEEKWDQVRTTLKIKAGPLWNLGDSKNPLVQFAKKEGDVDL